MLCQQDQYEKVYVFTHGTRQDTILNDYNGDESLDVLNTSIDFSENPPVRWLFIHFSSGGRFSKTADVMINLPDEAACLMFGDYDPNGGVEICYISTNGVYYYPFENKTILEKPKKLLHTKTFFTSGTISAIPIWSYADDLDGNKLHDIILPFADGYKIYLQTSKGAFGKTIILEEKIEKRKDKATASSEFVFKDRLELSFFSHMKTLPRLTAMDITGDGLKDLTVLYQDKVTIFKQDKYGNFIKLNTQTVPLLQTIEFKDEVQVLSAFFVDIDNNAKPELVVVRNKGKFGTVESVETQIIIHRGFGDGKFKTDKSLKIRGISINPQFLDLNNDGFVDVFASRIESDFLKKVIEGVIMGDIEIKYDVYQYFPAKLEHVAVSEIPIFLKLRDAEKKPLSTLPIVAISPDLNGDKKGELVTIDPRDHELRIFKGKEKFGHDRRSEIDFDKEPYFRAKIDRHPRYMDFNDVNGDGVFDIVLYHRSAVGFFMSRK